MISEKFYACILDKRQNGSLSKIPLCLYVYIHFPYIYYIMICLCFRYLQTFFCFVLSIPHLTEWAFRTVFCKISLCIDCEWSVYTLWNEHLICLWIHNVPFLSFLLTNNYCFIITQVCFLLNREKEILISDFFLQG